MLLPFAPIWHPFSEGPDLVGTGDPVGEGDGGEVAVGVEVGVSLGVKVGVSFSLPVGVNVGVSVTTADVGVCVDVRVDVPVGVAVSGVAVGVAVDVCTRSGERGRPMEPPSSDCRSPESDVWDVNEILNGGFRCTDAR